MNKLHLSIHVKSQNQPIAKDLSVNAVKAAMFAYLDCYKGFTTLEIKELLRQKGYYAVQQDVSKIVETIANQIGLWSFNLKNSFGITHKYYSNVR